MRGSEWYENYSEHIVEFGRVGFICRGCDTFFQCYRKDRKYCTNECRLSAYKKDPKLAQPLVHIRRKRATPPYHAYINAVKDNDTFICVKFGIEIRKGTRYKTQNKRSVYEVSPMFSYVFENKTKALKAETECKAELTCKVLPKQEMPDGYTETTHCHNIERIQAIYRKHGGELVH